MSLRILFAGTPEFSVPPLRALLASGHSVVGVYTQPDRPAGRGRQVAVSPVKAVALEHGLAVHQPVSFKAAEDVAALAAVGADLMVVVAYGLLLPQRILDAPRLGCVNIHASLLPRWRGASRTRCGSSSPYATTTIRSAPAASSAATSSPALKLTG